MVLYPVRNAEFSETPMTKSVDDKLDAKERKRQDRFNGLTEEEVSQRTLPDHLASNLDIIIVRKRTRFKSGGMNGFYFY